MKLSHPLRVVVMKQVLVKPDWTDYHVKEILQKRCCLNQGNPMVSILLEYLGSPVQLDYANPKNTASHASCSCIEYLTDYHQD